MGPWVYMHLKDTVYSLVDYCDCNRWPFIIWNSACVETIHCSMSREKILNSSVDHWSPNCPTVVPTGALSITPPNLMRQARLLTHYLPSYRREKSDS